MISCNVDKARKRVEIPWVCPPVLQLCRSGVVRLCDRNARLSCSAGWPQHTAVINYQHHLITKITAPLFGLCQLSRGRTVGRDIQPDPASSWQLVLTPNTILVLTRSCSWSWSFSLLLSWSCSWSWSWSRSCSCSYVI